MPAGVVPSQDEAIRELVLRSARALGIGTLASLGDYYRLAPTLVVPVVEDLVAEGELIAVTVPGWGEAYLHPSARLPRSVHGRALLAPFDPLVFERPRLLALFGMHYRIGIYTPEAQRTHGYYVLPFLLGEAMVARVDLKADRAAGTLVVKHAHLEPEFRDPQTRRRTAWPSPAQVAHELVAELNLMREWLGLERVTVDEQAQGDLVAPTLHELAS